MKIEIDKRRCEGHGQCELIAPQFFEVKDGSRIAKAYLKTTEISAADLPLLESVVERCPAFAVHLTDD